MYGDNIPSAYTGSEQYSNYAGPEGGNYVAPESNTKPQKTLPHLKGQRQYTTADVNSPPTNPIASPIQSMPKTSPCM